MFFLNLDNKHPDDNKEFSRGINTLQYLVAKRVAARVDKDIWGQY